MARAHKGDRVPVALRIPKELFDEVEAECAKFDVERHAFLLAMVVRGMKNWKAS
jgi:hypothetical protein